MGSILSKINWKKVGTFAGGVLFGTAGIKILSSRDAKQVYTGVTAAALRGRDCVLKQVNVLQENAEDIYADALAINEERNAMAEEEIFEDICAEDEVADENPAE